MLDQVLVLDSSERVVATLSNTLPGACPIVSLRQQQEAQQGGGYADTIYITVPSNHADAEHIADGNHVIFRDADGHWQEYRLVRPEKTTGTESYIVAYGEHAFYELRGEWLDDIRPTNTSADMAVSQALSGARWTLGTADDLGQASVRIYKTSVLAGLSAIAAAWGGELRFRVSLIGGVIAGRYVDILTRRGADTGKRFEYRKDLRQVTQTIDRSGLYTALVGRGKGVEVSGGTDTTDPAYGRRLEFADIAWSVANGDPADKPLGQNWIGDSAAAAQYGPGGRHIFGTVQYSDCTDAGELLARTYDALQTCKQPAVTYRMDVIALEELAGMAHEAVRLGDTVVVVNTALPVPDVGQARVFSIDRNLIDARDCLVTLGNYLPSLATKQAGLIKQQLAMADRAGVWDRANVFQPAEAGGSIELMLDLLRVQLASTVSGVSTDANGNIIIENPEKTAALKLGAGIFALAKEKAGGEYVWRTFGNGAGFTAAEIILGVLRSADSSVWIDLDNNTFNFANKIIWDGSDLTFNLTSGSFSVRAENVSIAIVDANDAEVTHASIDDNGVSAERVNADALYTGPQYINNAMPSMVGARASRLPPGVYDIYVWPTGDNNKSGLGGWANAKRTIASVLETLPRYLDGAHVYIHLYSAVNYGEDVVIDGFYGSGSITIGKGAIDAHVQVNQLTVSNCRVPVTVFGVIAGGAQISDCSNVLLNNCGIAVAGSGNNGAYITGASNVTIRGTEINAFHGIWVTGNSTAYAETTRGDCSYAGVAREGSVLRFFNTRPYGGTSTDSAATIGGSASEAHGSGYTPPPVPAQQTVQISPTASRARRGSQWYGESGDNLLAYGSYDGQQYTGSMWFDLSALAGKTVIAARLRLLRRNGVGSSATENITVYRLTSPASRPSGSWPTGNAPAQAGTGRTTAVPRNVATWLDVNNDDVQAIIGGSAVGLILNTGSTGYGKCDGVGDATPPILEVTYQ